MIGFGENTRRFGGVAFLVLFVMTCGWSCSNDNGSTTDIAASVNTAPIISSVTASPNTVHRGGTSQITVTAADPEGDELTIWYSPSGGTITANGNSASWTAPSAPGKYILTVTISDGRLSSEAWVAITVFVPLTTLHGTLTLPSGHPGNLANTQVILRAGATSLAGDSLVKRVPVIGSGTNVTFTIDKVMPGNYYLEAWRDVDHNGYVSVGDFYGQYGSGGQVGEGLPTLTINEGETRFLNIQMAAVPENPDDDVIPGDPRDDRPTGKEGDIIANEDEMY